jgi:hypothetical protein
MHNIISRSLLILSLASAVPLLNQSETRAGDHNCCCQSCRQPCGRCNCGAPQTAYQPVVETQYAQQPVWQQRDVVATEYRNEQTIETVPKTVMENVTVDEGGYQTVWVPRLTTKAVARTVYQTRTACRTVPYQVTRRVTECATQTVPYQSVRYAPTNGSAIGYSTSPGYASAIVPPNYSGNTIASSSYPTLASSRIAPTPAGGSSIANSSAGRVPDSRFAEAPVTAITPRSASTASRSSGTGADNRMAERSSLFVPAPSAAQVWRSTVTR